MNSQKRSKYCYLMWSVQVKLICYQQSNHMLMLWKHENNLLYAVWTMGKLFIRINLIFSELL